MAFELGLPSYWSIWLRNQSHLEMHGGVCAGTWIFIPAALLKDQAVMICREDMRPACTNPPLLRQQKEQRLCLVRERKQKRGTSSRRSCLALRSGGIDGCCMQAFWEFAKAISVTFSSVCTSREDELSLSSV